MTQYRISLERYLEEFDNKFDVLITCTNQEKRSSRSFEIMQKHGTAIQHHIDVILENRSNTEIKVFQNQLTVNCPYNDVIEGTTAIINALQKYKGLTTQSKILVDISSFIKPYFFHLLKKLIIINKQTNVLISYTEPESYKKSSGKFEFDRGTNEVAEMPGFGYHEDTDKKRLLVLILGFEGDRILDVQVKTEPNQTIAINGLPSYIIDYKDNSILQNKRLFANSQILYTMKHASASDPFETKAVLEEIYSLWNNTHNITVSPMGTKPMALGALLFVMKHPDVRVVFSFPKDYNPNPSSTNFGKSWIYQIN